jgi:hypothetical protein
MPPDLHQPLRALGRMANVIDKPARRREQADPDDNPAPHEQRGFGETGVVGVMLCVSHGSILPRRRTQARTSQWSICDLEK